MQTRFWSFKQWKKATEKDFSEKIIFIASTDKFKSASFYSTIPLSLKNRLSQLLARRKDDLKAGAALLSQGIEKNDPDLILAALPEDREAFPLLGFARDILKRAIEQKTKSLTFVFVESSLEAELADIFGAAAATRIFQIPVFGNKKKDQKSFLLESVDLVGLKNQQKKFDYGFATGEGNNLIRRLAFLPPNILDTHGYGKEIRELARKHKLGVKFYPKQKLKEMGAGAFTAVDQGDPNSGGGIYELSYLPTKAKNKDPISLVGKGLCFDTGGYDVKTNGYMAGMKGDMQGSALALASLIAIAKLKLPLRVRAFLGVTENHISPRAYKPDEVVTALNGKSIEIINTDAEGRMVLADTLTLASRTKPALIMDFATLTGAAIYSIGKSYAAGFTNREAFHPKIVRAGRDSGERVWTFPLDKDFGKALESDVADTLQCSKQKGVDHILAAFFLKQFIEKDVPWVHIDLACSEKSGGLAHTETEFTGFGVRFALQFLREQFRL